MIFTGHVLKNRFSACFNSHDGLRPLQQALWASYDVVWARLPKHLVGHLNHHGRALASSCVQGDDLVRPSSQAQLLNLLCQCIEGGSPEVRAAGVQLLLQLIVSVEPSTLTALAPLVPTVASVLQVSQLIRVESHIGPPDPNALQKYPDTPFLSRCFCKCMSCIWLEVLYTPLSCITCIGMLLQKYEGQGSLEHPQDEGRLSTQSL